MKGISCSKSGLFKNTKGAKAGKKKTKKKATTKKKVAKKKVAPKKKVKKVVKKKTAKKSCKAKKQSKKVVKKKSVKKAIKKVLSKRNEIKPKVERAVKDILDDNGKVIGQAEATRQEVGGKLVKTLKAVADKKEAGYEEHTEMSAIEISDKGVAFNNIDDTLGEDNDIEKDIENGEFKEVEKGGDI